MWMLGLKEMLGMSTLEVDYVYQGLMQSIKNCKSSLQHYLSETDQSTTCIGCPIQPLRTSFCWGTTIKLYVLDFLTTSSSVKAGRCIPVGAEPRAADPSPE